MIEEKDKELLEALITKYGADEIIEEGKLAKAAAAGLLGLALAGGMHKNVDTVSPEQTHAAADAAKNNLKNMEVFTDGENTYTLDEVALQVQDYITAALKYQGIDPSRCKLDPRHMVDACVEGTYNLSYLLAQVKKETQFATVGRAVKTNSAFGVGAYNNGKNAVVYDDVNQSVDGYIRLVNTDYRMLGTDNQKSWSDLLSGPGTFVNYAGKAYSQMDDGTPNPKYERDINQIAGKINSNYPAIAAFSRLMDAQSMS